MLALAPSPVAATDWSGEPRLMPMGPVAIGIDAPRFGPSDTRPVAVGDDDGPSPSARSLLEAERRCSAQRDRAERRRCLVEAKGVHQVAVAEQLAHDDPTPARLFAVSEARADAARDLALQRCDPRKPPARDVCEKDAEAAHVAAIEAAKIELATADPAGTPQARDARLAEARAEAARHLREAHHAAARERCRMLERPARAACLAEAKRRFD